MAEGGIPQRGYRLQTAQKWGYAKRGGLPRGNTVFGDAGKTMRTVVEFNGPGNNGSEVRDGIAYEIQAGDVVVIPAGIGHWFTRIEDHIDNITERINPDKVTPLKSEAQSQEYLSKPARRGE
jgi:hypothetical protein